MNIGTDEDVRGRIRQFITLEGLTQDEFARNVGISPQNLGQVLKGNRGVPKNLVSKIIAAYPKIYDQWLLLGLGEMLVEDNVYEEEEENTKPRLPLTAAAGVLSDYLGGVLAHECEQMPIIRSMPDYDFTMIVKGNSMEPKYEGGDEIACKQVQKTIEWGKTYVLATRDGAVLKRLYKSENGDGVRCVSYNHEEYPDFEVSADDILGVYRVVGLIRI